MDVEADRLFEFVEGFEGGYCSICLLCCCFVCRCDKEDSWPFLCFVFCYFSCFTFDVFADSEETEDLVQPSFSLFQQVLPVFCLLFTFV